MNKHKWLIEVAHNSFFVCSVRTAGNVHIPDTDDGHFSFGVFGIDPSLFADVLENTIKYCNHVENQEDLDHYYLGDDVILKASNRSDYIRIVRDRTELSITRGNMKILYHGTTRRLVDLPKELRKAVKAYEIKYKFD